MSSEISTSTVACGRVCQAIPPDIQSETLLKSKFTLAAFTSHKSVVIVIEQNLKSAFESKFSIIQSRMLIAVQTSKHEIIDWIDTGSRTKT